MRDRLASITAYVAGLQSREKIFVAVGTLLILALLSIKALLPLGQTFTELTEQQQQLEADLLWLQQQRETVAKLANNCPLLRHQQDSQSRTLSQLVRRNQWLVERLDERGGKISLAVTGDDSNRLLQLIHQIACYGFAVETIEINRPESSDGGSAKLRAVLEVRNAD